MFTRGITADRIDTHKRARRGRWAAGLAALAVVAAGFGAGPTAATAAPTTQSTTFSYTGGMQAFTVPANVTELTVTLTGAEGGRGGRDSQGEPIAGGYKGVVTGTIAVVPGQTLSLSVGGGGARGNSSTNAQVRAAGGVSPLAGYAGGPGGMPGGSGSSGAGGGGGAATVLVVGDVTLVAGGAGGGGGSGQWTPLVGRQAEASHKARTDATSGNGQTGYDVQAICRGNCDGGGSGAGGGGAQGGAQGTVEFGTGTYTEWLGYGGFPGSNSVGGLATLSASYAYFSGNSGGGSITISYTTGAADAPTSVVGQIGDGQVGLTWNAPANTGGAAITDYVVQYAVAGATPAWQTVDDGTSTATSAVVTGLTNGLSYVFRVQAINAFGTSVASAATDPLRPSSVPGAPVLTALTARDGGLTVTFDPASSTAPVTRYEYRVDGGGWQSLAGTSSPATISGLRNGVAAAIELRAVNVIGAGAASNALSGTPVATPGAPTITSVTPGVGRVTVGVEAGFTGGVAITGYEYRLGSGAWTTLDGVSPFTIRGLADGAELALQVRALNVAGGGSPSASLTFTTADAPAAPTVVVTRGDGSLRLAVTPGSDRGSSVSAFEYRLDGGAWVRVAAASPIVVTGLANGTPVDIQVRAVNAVGAGAASAVTRATPATVPSAPVIVGETVANGAGRLKVTFDAPTSTGGDPVVGYEYSTDAGATWHPFDPVQTSSPQILSVLSSDGVTPLVGGQEYPIEIRAVNGVGAGHASAMAVGIPRTAPDAPRITSVDVADGTLRIAFAPGANGGEVVTGYEYRLDATGDWISTGGLATWFEIAGLANGIGYSVEVRALNVVGASAPSAPAAGIPARLPAQPVIGLVLPTDRTLTVEAELSSDGGSDVVRFEYTTDGGLTWRSAGDELPLVIDTVSDGSGRLVNGESYAVSMRAVTAAGTGPGSALSLLTPREVPAQPVVDLTAGEGSVTVAYSVADDGGNPLQRIEYRVGAGGWLDAGTLAASFPITGLPNGVAASVQVRAVNAAGAGQASIPVAATPRTVPGAPTEVTATAGDRAATIGWSAPAENGGAPVTTYTATVWPTATSLSPTGSCTTSSATCTVSGLTNLTTYFVSVAATNAAGTGDSSAPRIAVTPAARPAAPTITGITANNTFLQVAFTAGSAGSAAITGYQYSLNGGEWRAAGGTSSPITLSGLVNGTVYSVQLRAVSSVGAGTASSAVSGTPYTLPDAPDAATIVADSDNGQATVTWAAPAANGATITQYQVVAWSASTQGSQQRTCTSTGALSCTLTSLSNGTTYYVTIDATNAAGTSTRSTPRVPVTVGTPGRVGNVAGVAGDGQVTLTWDAGATGASAVSDYTIWVKAAGASSYTQFADGTSTTRSATVTGLTNGTSYSFQVRAVNSYGAGAAQDAASAVMPIGVGVAPTLTAPVRTADGFTTTIAAPNGSTTYTASTTAGTATVDGASVTVTGLAPDEEATVTVVGTRHGYTTASSDLTGTALATGIDPELSASTAVDGGFTFAIDDYSDDDAVEYTVETDAGTVTRVGGAVTATGLAGGQTATVTVTVRRPGYTDAVVTVVATALPAAAAPAVGIPVRTVDGYVVAVTPAAGQVHGYTIDAGALSADAGILVDEAGTLTVTGLAPGQSATITVTAAGVGLTTTTSTIVAAALTTGSAATLSPGTPTADGFTATLSGPAGASYDLAVDAGSVALSGTTIIVSGLAPSASATVTVTTRLDGATDATSSIAGTALDAGVVPTWGAPVATDDGFTFALDNYDSDRGYTVTVSAGTVAFVDGVVTVTGLGVGESATVTIVTTKDGEADVVTEVVFRSIAIGTAPALGALVAGQNGFTVVIGDYDPATSYFLAVTAGTVTRAGAVVTVSGIPALSTAELTVSAMRPGFTTATSTVIGAAAAPPAPAPAPAPATTPATPAPVVATSPVVPHQAPGSVFGRVGGEVVAPTTSAGPGGVTVEVGPASMTVVAVVNGAPAPTGPGGVVVVNRGGDVQVEVTGFAPDSILDTWIFSQPMHLTGVTVPASGVVRQATRIPLGLELGEHTLVVTGTAADGSTVEMSLGLLVVDTEAQIADTVRSARVDAFAGSDRAAAPRPAAFDASGLWWWLLLLLAVPAVWFVVARSRAIARVLDEE